jgi:hypothetical protein
MTIGRISGPLLKDNLLRDGVNLRFENDLLFLKVNDANSVNHRIGIKNPNPAHPLDITGTARANTFLVTDGRADIDDVRVDGRTVSTTVGSLEIQAATLTDRVNINSDTKVTGNLEVTGNIQLGGNINIGDQDSDEVVFGAEIASSIIPDITITYDLGTDAKRWRTLYSDSIDVNNLEISGDIDTSEISISGNTITTVNDDTNLQLGAAGNGSIVILGNSSLILPVGTTAERPDPPEVGMVRFNTDDARVENYNGEEWNRMVHDDDAIAFAIALG